MADKNTQEIIDLIRPHLEQAGFTIERIEVEASDDPEHEGDPIANVYVNLGDTVERMALKMLQDAEETLSDALGCEIDGGYFTNPEFASNQVLLEFSGFPFDLRADNRPTP